MAKKVKENRLVIILELTRGDGTGPLSISCNAQYEVTSEGLEEKRTYGHALTPPQQDAVKNFGATILAKIKEKEESGKGTR